MVFREMEMQPVEPDVTAAELRLVVERSMPFSVVMAKLMDAAKERLLTWRFTGLAVLELHGDRLRNLGYKVERSLSGSDTIVSW